MATVYNYYAVILSFTPVNVGAGIYKCQYYIMNNSTVAASTEFWSEANSSSTPLASPPTSLTVPEITLNGTSQTAILASLQTEVNTLVARLEAKYPTAVSLPAGTITPVTVTY
jgi:hypothetical protein